MIDHNQQISFPQLDELIAAAPEAETRQPAVRVTATAQLTMSSLQIAEITGKRHTDVLRDIRNTLEQAEIDERKFASSYFNAQNKEQPCYHLPRRECDLVVSGYSVKYRLAIIDRWHQLESRPAVPVNLNDPGFLRGLLMDYTEKVLVLETTVSELTPKAEALETLTGCEGLMNITNAAKVLQVKPKDLFRYLDSHGWTYRRPGSSERVPYQNRISQGFMVAKAHRGINDQTGEEFIKERALLTPKGLARLAELKIAG